ncbi:MAG: aminodeoxychorismate/anthranilate synthase component II [Proteobacteria bacterium]|nr:aminodeoxychorismate/anthranilate synthase component II [Pseudomonadota bacterium]
MILLIDNYDSFTYNLYQYLGEMGETLKVIRNDKISLEGIKKLNPEQIVLSPGPGRPKNAGICCELIKQFSDKIPILGICLGFQGIGEVFGANLVHAPELFHGKKSWISHTGNGVFVDLPSRIEVARYHSLILEKKSIPPCFEITSWTDNQLVMGIRHQELPLEGIQFHPESILTETGKRMLDNFLKNSRRFHGIL